MSPDRHRMAVASHLLLRNRLGQILYLRRAGGGYGSGCWSIPAGHVDYGETAAAACVREAAEEVGVVLEISALRFLLVQHKHDLDGQERVDLFFEADLPSGQEATMCEPDKCDALMWGAAEQPEHPTLGYLAAALGTIAAGRQPFASFGFDEPGPHIAGDAASDLRPLPPAPVGVP